MLRKILFFIVIFLFLLLPMIAFAYPWPVSSFSSQHKINATLGEYRSDHFHAGVDIGEGAGTNVYPVISGKIEKVVTTGDNAYVRVKDNANNKYEYIHIVPSVAEGDSVTAGITVIGTIKSITQPHLHFEENNGAVNPLRVGGLTPFADTTATVIESVDFWRQGTNDQLTGNELWGQVDLRVDAYDPRTSATGGNADGHCGIYRIIIEFRSNGNLISSIDYHRYDSVPSCALGLVYASGSSTSNFLYWATNNPFTEPYNRYWNTKQKRGYDYTVDAVTNDDALYSDGLMLIRVIVEDIRGNRATYDIGQE